MKEYKLKRDLGLFHATTLGVGIILGAGIYVLIGEAAGITGNSIWMSFLFSAFVALLTGLSYAELTAMMPVDAAEYTYTKRAFGKFAAFIIGYLVVLSAIISASTVATGFAGYFGELFNVGSLIIVSIAIVIVFTIINYRSIKEAAWANVLFTGLEALGLLFIIVVGFFFIGEVNIMEMPNGFQGMFKASALVFFAFLGFECISKLCEEVKEPRKTIPRALLLSIAITSVIYVLVAIAAVNILDWQVLGESKAPLATVAASVFGNNAFVAISIIALFSTANTVLISLIAASRGLYGVSANYKLLSIFRRVHKNRRTPHIAIIAVMIIAILFCFIEEINVIAELTNFTLFVTFAVINLALIVLRYSHAKDERSFKVPLNIGKFPLIAFFGFVFCIFMMFQLSLMTIAGGSILILIGILLYFAVWFVERRVLE